MHEELDGVVLVVPILVLACFGFTRTVCHMPML